MKFQAHQTENLASLPDYITTLKMCCQLSNHKKYKGQDCVNLAKALYKGGIRMMEVTFDQSKPEYLNQISDMVKLFPIGD